MSTQFYNGLSSRSIDETELTFVFPLSSWDCSSEEGPRSSIIGSNLKVFIVFHYLYRDVNVTTMKWSFWMTGKYGSPEQSCKLHDLKLQMPGDHQLQNAATATCVALCLRSLGWMISDESIRRGLESTYLLGRSQLLTSEDAKVLGLTGATILLDGAHTKESAKALMNTIKMAFPKARLAFVVAMACDKDHAGFAREILSGANVETVILTEAAIAGAVTRTTPTPLLRDSWIKASKELSVGICHEGMTEYCELLKEQPVSPESNLSDGKTILATKSSLKDSLKVANEILNRRRDEKVVIVITGSLHIVSSVLASLAD